MSESREMTTTEMNAATPIVNNGALVPAFESMGQVLAFAQVMAKSKIAVRKQFRDNPGACAAVCMQAMRWGLDPYAVANKSYEVNDQLGYESQLIAAVINMRAPIVGRLKVRFDGTGDARTCTAYATFIGDTEPTEVTSPPFGRITPKNSPLWKTDPDQQLSYYTKRLWARRECPEVMLGVYDVEELQTSPRGPDHARDITPQRPTLADYTAASVNPTTGEVVDVEADDGFDPILFAEGLTSMLRQADSAEAVAKLMDANCGELEKLDAKVRKLIQADADMRRDYFNAQTDEAA